MGGVDEEEEEEVKEHMVGCWDSLMTLEQSLDVIPSVTFG